MSDPDQERCERKIPEPRRDGGQREAAHHIMSEVEGLRALARRHRLDMLGYLLDMAHLEARGTLDLQDESAP